MENSTDLKSEALGWGGAVGQAFSLDLSFLIIKWEYGLQGLWQAWVPVTWIDHDVSDRIKILSVGKIIKRSSAFELWVSQPKHTFWRTQVTYTIYLHFRQLFPVTVMTNMWVLSVKNLMPARGNPARTMPAVLMQMKSKMGAISPVSALLVWCPLLIVIICLFLEYMVIN